MTTRNQYLREKEDITARIQAIDYLFPKPDDHVNYLCGFIPGGLKCRFCQSDKLEWQSGARIVECGVCLRTSRPTASTFFHNVRLVPNWVRALALLESGYVFSANLFATVTGMSPSSALMMLHRIRYVIAVNMNNKAVQTSAACMNVVCKRSRKTPGSKHPKTEQDEYDEMTESWLGSGVDSLIEKAIAKIYEPKNQQTTDTKQVDHRLKPDVHGFLWANEKKIFKQLSYDPVSFDWLVSNSGLQYQELVMSLLHLEISGLAQKTDGHNYVQKRLALPILAQSLNSIKVDLKDFFRVIKSNFHGISRKYLQLYIAQYWCSINRLRWNAGSLFRACFRKGRITELDIKQYVSPPVVSTWVEPAAIQKNTAHSPPLLVEV